MNNFKTSPAALKEIKAREIRAKIGCMSLNAFKDDGSNTPTIGWGRVQGVQMGDTIDLETAERYFAEDVGIAERAVRAALKVPVNQGQWNACVIMTFNVGGGAFGKSQIVKLINAGKFDDVPAQWMRWCYATDKETGKKLRLLGLERRRRAELGFWRELDQPDREEGVVIVPGSITDRPPVPGKVAEVLATSNTIRGALLALTAKVTAVVGDITGFFATSHAEVQKMQASLDPMVSLWGMVKGIGPNMLTVAVIGGIGWAVWCRINAGLQGKIG
jgi:GH24 family phage-related lysozyme (muramidase)